MEVIGVIEHPVRRHDVGRNRQPNRQIRRALQVKSGCGTAGEVKRHRVSVHAGAANYGRIVPEGNELVNRQVSPSVAETASNQPNSIRLPRSRLVSPAIRVFNGRMSFVPELRQRP